MYVLSILFTNVLKRWHPFSVEWSMLLLQGSYEERVEGVCENPTIHSLWVQKRKILSSPERSENGKEQRGTAQGRGCSTVIRIDQVLSNLAAARGWGWKCGWSWGLCSGRSWGRRGTVTFLVWGEIVALAHSLEIPSLFKGREDADGCFHSFFVQVMFQGHATSSCLGPLGHVAIEPGTLETRTAGELECLKRKKLSCRIQWFSSSYCSLTCQSLVSWDQMTAVAWKV